MVVSCDQKVKPKSKKSKRKQLTSLERLRKCRTFSGFLGKITSPFQFGWNKGAYTYRRFNVETTVEGLRQYSKEYTIEQYNKHKYIRRWNKDELADHLGGNITLYFAGAGGLNTPFTLVLIDVDALKALGKGSKAGAEAFARYLKTIWPELYFEPSTGGQGVHAYLLIDKRRCDARQLNASLKHLQDYLRSLAVGHDIEQVEVKGTAPIIVWDDHKIESIQYGQLAKLPRDGYRWEELKNTTCLTVGQLMRLDIPSNARHISNEYTTSKQDTGSCSAVPFHKDLRFRVENGDLEELARRWIGAGISGGNRTKISPAEFGFALATIAHCTVDGNKDGSLPTARAKAIWDAGRAEGLVSKGWNHYKWAAVRNWLSAHGYLSTQDMDFEIGTTDCHGEYHKGLAARWGASEHLLDLVSAAPRTRNGDAPHPVDETSFATPGNEQELGTNQAPEEPPFSRSTGGQYHLYGADGTKGLTSRKLTIETTTKHPREPSPFAVMHGMQTYEAPRLRQPSKMKMRA